jgi:hypothetical protein
LYDDLELLENLQLIRTEATAESTPAESADIDKLNFEDLMGGLDADLDGVSKAADSFEERRFTLTEKGRERVEKLLQVEGLQSVTNGIRSIKSRFSKHSLRDLLKYVYTKYPGMTTESEIIDKVLGRRKR